jgi:hypothetical protein
MLNIIQSLPEFSHPVVLTPALPFKSVVQAAANSRLGNPAHSGPQQPGIPARKYL